MLVKSVQFFAFHVTEVKLLQPLKALRPMLVTLLGMVTEVKPVQPWKASIPMLVTLLGIVTEVKPVQRKKALRPMLVTLLGIVTEVKLHAIGNRHRGQTAATTESTSAYAGDAIWNSIRALFAFGVLNKGCFVFIE